MNLPNQADDGRPSPVPKIISEQGVAAELRTADDKLMTAPGCYWRRLFHTRVVSRHIIRRDRAVTDSYSFATELRLAMLVKDWDAERPYSTTREIGDE